MTEDMVQFHFIRTKVTLSDRSVVRENSMGKFTIRVDQHYETIVRFIEYVL